MVNIADDGAGMALFNDPIGGYTNGGLTVKTNPFLTSTGQFTTSNLYTGSAGALTVNQLNSASMKGGFAQKSMDTALQLFNGNQNAMKAAGVGLALLCIKGASPRKPVKLAGLAAGLYMSGLPQMLAAKVPVPALQNPFVSTAVATAGAMAIAKSMGFGYRRFRRSRAYGRVYNRMSTWRSGARWKRRFGRRY